MASTKIGDITAVIWQDAATNNEWRSLEEHLACPNALVISVGTVIQWDRKVVRLAQSVGFDGETADVLTVPRSLVRKVAVLKRGRRLRTQAR